MRFHYTAYHPQRKVVEGDVEATTKEEVLRFLATNGLKPITVKPVARGVSLGEKISGLGGKITLTDKMFLTRYLSLMLKMGTDLFSAIDILIADLKKPAMQSFLNEVKSNLQKGQPFYLSFARYPKYFPETFTNLIKAGEESGTLDKVLLDLSVSLEKSHELRGKIRGALIYPILLLTVAMAILTFLVTFALPRIAGVFSGGGFNPPTFSKVVFAVGLFLEQYIWFIFGIGAALIAALLIFFIKTKAGRRAFARFINFIPYVRQVVKKIAMQRFTGTFSSLLKAGMPLLDSLKITANAVGNEYVKEALVRIADEGVAKGLTLGEAFRREAVFPKIVVNFIAISEKAGHLDEILDKLSSFYETEIDRSLKTLVSVTEPVLLILIGIVVAVIALSIIVPIYQLVGQF